MTLAWGRQTILVAGLLIGTVSAQAYKTSLGAVHFGSSLGGAYAGQIGSTSASWDLVAQLAASGYTSSSQNKTPLRMGFFYRHPQFTVDAYLRYFTSYQSGWDLSGVAGNSRYKGIGGGIDFEMPVYLSEWFRAGLLVNAEYLKNRVVITYSGGGGLEASSTNALFGGGVFSDLYVGDLWSIGLRGLYAYDLGGTWRARTAGTLFGTSHTAGAAILDPDGNPAKSSFSHWRAEAVLRLAFY